MKRRRLRLSLGWLAAIGVTIALYGWILHATRGLGPIGGRKPDYYNLLVHGFLHGQLSLDAPVPAELLKLANPYDPAQRPPGLGLHDATLYHGRYYIYFGPTAVVLLMLPFTALTGNDLPVGCAVGCFVLLGYLGQLAIFRYYQRRYYPRSSGWITTAAALALGCCGFQLVLLARHSMYELPIACGAACFWWALYLLLRGVESPTQRLSSLGAGLAWGLAIASRPIYLFTLPLLALPLLRPLGWRRVLTSAAAGGAVLALLLTYNFARFGNPLEFGQNFQLSGAIEGEVRHFSLSFLPFNLREYFWSGFSWGRYFPFIHLNPPAVLPSGLGGFDAAFGMLTNLPIYLLGLAGLFAVRKVTLPLGATFGAAVVLTLVLGGYFGCVVRYEHDFAPAWLLLACLGLLAAEGRIQSTGLRAGWRVAALGLSMESAFVALLAAMTLHHQFAISGPQAWTAAGRLSNAPIGAAERLAGRRIAGSVRLKLVFPAQPKFVAEPLLVTGWPGERDGIWVEYPDASSIRFQYYHGSDHPIAHSPVYPLAATSPHEVTISLGSLYPPVTHPYFHSFSAAERGARLARVKVSLDHHPAWQIAAECFESTPALTELGTDRDDPRRFSGQILETQAIELSPLPVSLASRPLKLNVSLSANWTGRAFPLVSSGQTGAGDVLFIRMLSPTLVQFGYDHWGSATIVSAPVLWPMGRSQPLEIHLPLAGPDVGTDSLRILTGTRELWSAQVRRFPAQPYEAFPRQNLLGASTCEDNLPDSATPGW